MAIRRFHGYVLPVWEQLVVHVPEANGVHAIVMSGDDVRDVARRAVASILDLAVEDVIVVLDQDESARD